MKRFLPIIIAVALPGVIIARAFSDPVPTDKLERLRRGMTQEEVRKVLGAPTKMYDSGQWTYKRAFVFGFVNIHWQADGTYDGDYNYERF